MVLDNDEEQLVSTAAIERSMRERLINEYQQQGYSSSGYDDDLDYGDHYDDHHSVASLSSMDDGDIAASIGPISDHDADFDYDGESGSGAGSAAESSSGEEGSDDDSVAEENYVDPDPLTFDFTEYPTVANNARLTKSCELFCLVQEQNLTRETHSKLIKLFNKWMNDEELCTYHNISQIVK